MTQTESMPKEIRNLFMERYDFVSAEAAKGNIGLMLQNKPVVAYHIWIELKYGEFSVESKFYNPGIFGNLEPAIEPCQLWVMRMEDSIRYDSKTYIIPFETYEEAEATATRFNELLREAAA